MNVNGIASHQAQPLVNMTHAMTSRGPDDEGYLLVGENVDCRCFSGDDTPSAKNYKGLPFFPDTHIATALSLPSILGLGHRRLSILDLSPGGHQPMCTRDGRYWIVFNGEIYNFKELAQQIRSHTIDYYGRSDTEILLNAYAILGKKCLDYLNGDFAFAIWDNKKRKLFCARDRVGIKPFYYTIQNNQFIFASDIKTIIASGLYTPSPDPEGLYLAMAFGIAPRPLTAFKDVKALEQGTWLEIDVTGTLTKGRYWDIPIGTQDDTMTEDEAAELLEHELQKATRLRLVADVYVGTFMSGGIDSTTISAMASRYHQGIKAFTLAYENNAPEMDETLQAIATAKMNPIEHIVHTVNPDDSLQYLKQWIEGYEEPFDGLAANYVISQLVRDNNVTVVLNGLGGDELFAGYGYYRFASLWPWVKMIRPLTCMSAFGRDSKIGRIIGLGLLRSPAEFHTYLFSKSSDAYRQSLFPNVSFSKKYTISRLQQLYAHEKVFDDPIGAMSYMDLMNYIGNHHVHRVDQFTMAHSIEGRFPFLDHHVIDAAFKIPSKYKIKSGLQKYILRKIAQKYIHSSCLSMKKKGFGLPHRKWMQGPLKKLVKDKIEKLKERRIICPQTVVKMYKKYMNQKIIYTKIWHLVALELWFERFIDQDENFLHSYINDF